jgi:hypothetical protein
MLGDSKYEIFRKRYCDWINFDCGEVQNNQISLEISLVISWNFEWGKSSARGSNVVFFKQALADGSISIS